MQQPPASCLRAAALQPSLWKEIRHPATGALLFKYDSKTNRIHIKRDRSEAIIHLDEYRLPATGRR